MYKVTIITISGHWPFADYTARLKRLLTSAAGAAVAFSEYAFCILKHLSESSMTSVRWFMLTNDTAGHMKRSDLDNLQKILFRGRKECANCDIC